MKVGDFIMEMLDPNSTIAYKDIDIAVESWNDAVFQSDIKRVCDQNMIWQYVEENTTKQANGEYGCNAPDSGLAYFSQLYNGDQHHAHIIFNRACYLLARLRQLNESTQRGETDNERVYFIKNGKQQMPIYDFVKAINPESPINPTHNYELLKEHRLKTYKDAEGKFIEQRNIDRVPTGELETNVFYGGWLRHELKVIDQWLSDTYPNGEKKKFLTSASNQIEILKYEQFVKTEIERIEVILNGPLNKVPSTTPHFPPNLLELPANVCEYLYTALIKDDGKIRGGFLHKDTNKLHFNYIFGGGVCPDDFAPLCWGKSKQAISELILLLSGGRSLPRKIQRDAGSLFTIKGRLIGGLSNPKKDEPSKDYGVLSDIVSSIKPHSP